MQVRAMLRQLVLLSTIFTAQAGKNLHLIFFNWRFSHVLQFLLIRNLGLARHPCLRECNPSTLPMTCHFDLTIEPYQTLSKACHACAYGNVTDCAREDCIYGDGIVRPITVVNRQMPGPPIRVNFLFKI